MLKVLYQKLRLKCKGSLNHNSNLSKKLQIDKVSRAIVQGIPVLSIFALVGILSYGLGVQYYIFASIGGSESAYAAETGTSASLIVDDGVINDKVDTVYNNFAYASHKITVEANNIESYTLTLAPNKTLTGPSVITGAGGKTPAQMTGASNYFGYAWTDTTANPTTATYDTLDTAKTLAGPPVNAATHSVSGSKQLVFGAKFGDGAASGTYSARATLSMVATLYAVVNYSITYNTNGGSVIANTTATDDTGAASKNLTISSTTPTLAGYKFAGWATTSGGAVAYQPGGNITLQASSPAITLYAVWQLLLNGITQMQQMTAEICESSAIGDISTLTDNRDGSTYTIRKNEDNNCWMTQSLRLVNKTISSVDSNVSSSFTVPASNISSFGTNYNANSVYYANNATYGAYYSWYTATAGSGTQSTTSGDAAYSICPKGWRLPSRADYSALATAIGAGNNNAGSTLFRNAVYKFQYAGHVNNGSLDDTNVRGSYWSRTASSGTHAYHLYLYTSNANPANTVDKYRGVSVRCVAYSS